MPGSRPRDTFPVRFKNPQTRAALKHLAEHTGSTMTDIVESAIEHEIALQGADLQRRLADALDVVQTYVAGAETEAYIDAAAAGERSGLEPMREMRSAHGPPAPVPGEDAGSAPDPYGVLAAFTRH